MDKEQLELRIKEIQTAIEQSAANHNGLLGRLLEAQHVLDNIKSIEAEAKETAKVIVNEMKDAGIVE